MGLAWSKDPESYAGGTVVTGRTGWQWWPRRKRTPWSSRLGVGRGAHNLTPQKKKIDVEKTSEIPQKGMINSKRSGYKRKDLIFGTWNVRILFQSGALLTLLSQLKQHKIKNKMRRRQSEGHSTDPRNTRVEETSRRQRRMETFSEEDQGPEGAIVPWMDGWMDLPRPQSRRYQSSSTAEFKISGSLPPLTPSRNTHR